MSTNAGATASTAGIQCLRKRVPLLYSRRFFFWPKAQQGLAIIAAVVDTATKIATPIGATSRATLMTIVVNGKTSTVSSPVHRSFAISSHSAMQQHESLHVRECANNRAKAALTVLDCKHHRSGAFHRFRV